MSGRLLALETSSPRLSLAAGTFESVSAVYEGPMQWRHAETLFQGLDHLLKKQRWPVRSLSGVAVSVGPGSFTGIRIGLAAARTLGQTLRIPVVGVSALEALAFGQEISEGLISPVIDALRGHVFAALYERSSRGAWRCLHPEIHWPLDRWRKAVRKAAKGRFVWMTGDALRSSSPASWSGLRVERAAERHWYPRAGAILELARPRLRQANPDSYRRALPLYLRAAAAQERRKT